MGPSIRGTSESKTDQKSKKSDKRKGSKNVKKQVKKAINIEKDDAGVQEKAIGSNQAPRLSKKEKYRLKREKYLARKGLVVDEAAVNAARAAAKAAKKIKKAQRSRKMPAMQPVEVPQLTKEQKHNLDPRAVDCFLTGLPYMAREEQIERHFASAGPCVAQVLRNEDGTSNGTGFLTFEAADQALMATGLHGSKIQNRWIGVRLCDVREDGPRGPGQKPDGCASVVLTGLSKFVSEEDLWTFFEKCKPSSVSLLTDKETGEPRGMAFVDFEDSDMVDRAVQKNGKILKGRPCCIRYKAEVAKEVKSAKEKGDCNVFEGKKQTFESDGSDSE